MNDHYKFETVPLPYSYSALEPYIDTTTMHLHHDRHYKTYVDNLNNILADYPAYQNWSLEKLLTQTDHLPAKIRTAVKNNAGGVYNHTLYFENMKPHSSTLSSGNLMRRITQEFGSYDRFKQEFKKQALAVFGSGYAWLVLTKFGGLKIITTANQDTPLPMDMKPIMLIDVWEHGYYLKHYNLRADYIDDWFAVVNLDRAEYNYNKGMERSGSV
ncbi:MAG: superoxide dismutase [Oscillospiraceae bacterium]|nr:superoxide dismutase [Oscillospiraceae bacterium]